MLVQCCIPECKAIKQGGRWVYKSDSQYSSVLSLYDKDKISHTYCPPCAEKVFEEMRKAAKIE